MDIAFKKIFSVEDVMNFSPQEREAYEEHLKWLRIKAHTLKKYETKGFAEENPEENQEEKKEIAKNMLAQGISREAIPLMADLPLEDFKNLFP